MSNFKLKSSKAIAMFLAVVMLVSVVPVSLFAAFATDGTDYFTVTVTDSSTDTPISDAQVTFEAENSSWELKTDPVQTNSKGKAKLEASKISDAMKNAEIKEARMKFTVKKFGYGEYSLSFDINIDDLALNKDVELKEREKTTLTGCVVDEKGKAYEDATVKMSGDLSATTMTNKDGKYSFEVYKNLGDYEITATAKEGEDKYEAATLTVKNPKEKHECENLQFKVKQFNITTSAGENGKITEATTVSYGDNKEIVATANKGYRIEKFTVNDEEKTEAKDKQEFTLNLKEIKKGYNISVTFYKATYTVSFDVSENGKVEYNSDKTAIGGKVTNVTVDEGGSVSFNAIADTDKGYHVEQVVIGDDEKLKDGTNETTEFKGTVSSENINTTVTVKVVFAVNTYNLTVDCGENGSAKWDKDTVNHGDPAKLTITPDAGYEIASVQVNGNDTDFKEDDNEVYVNIENITEDKAVKVEFKKIETATPEDDKRLENEYYKITFTKGKEEIEPVNTDKENGTLVVVLPKDAKATISPVEPYTKIKINDTYMGYNEKVSVDVNDADKNSEVKINNAYVKYYTSPFTTSKKNVTVNVKIIFDKTAPTISEVTNSGKWFNDKATYSFTVSDDHSGVAEVKYGKESDISKATKIEAVDGKYSFTVDEEFNGNYYIWATDGAGNVSEAKKVNVQIDKTAPEISGFTFEIANTSLLEKIINRLTFGIFCSTDMKLTVTAIDKANEKFNSGLNKIVLKYFDTTTNKFEEIKGDFDSKNNNAVFKLAKNVFENGAEIKAYAVDKAGNNSDEKMPEPSEMVKINDTEPTVKIVPEDATYTKETDKKDENGETIKELWYNKKELEFDITVQGPNTGIYSIAVKINNTDITTGKNGSDFNKGLGSDKDAEAAVESRNFSVKTPEDAVNEGENTITVTVTNNAGLTTTETQKFYVDTKAPEIKEFNIESNIESTTVEKVLNFLTFGTFYNNKVKVTVTASDGENSSDVQFITLYADGEKFGTKEVEKNQATFIIPAEEITDSKLHFNATLSATATDNVTNVTAKPVAPTTVNSNIKNSGLMIETVDPIISVSYADPAQNKNSATADENKWYNDDVEFKFDVKDEDSGLKNVTISINDEDLVNKDLYENEEKISSEKYIVNTENATIAKDGSYIVKATVTDNAGNVKEESYKIYKDVDAPYIIGFDFDAVEFVEGSETASTVEVTDYGFYFKEDTKVTVSAKDDAPSSGIKSITYYTVNKDTGKSEEKTLDVNKDGQIEFTVEANFKGQIYAKATDNVGNTPEKFVNPNSAIVEDEAKHKEETHIIFTKEETAFTANDNTPLYSDDVPVKLTVIDTYSGIRSIEWSVEAPYDSDNDQSGKVTLNNDKSFTEDSEKGWTKAETEGNLVTKMEKDIVVNNNSNNIIVNVKMVDRAGNESEEKLEISIDKTAPTIEVVYDNNKPDEKYKDIYKENRTATITVTERNFRAEDIVFAITNTDNVIPSTDLKKASVWKTVADKEDPDNTVHIAKIKYTADGDYTFNISYKDNAQNAAKSFKQHKFTIDKTIPVVTVTYDNNDARNGNYYNADRVATVTVKEHNFDSARIKNLGVATDDNNPSSFPMISAWTDNGDDTHTATIVYDADSKYTFDIEVVDKAGNSIEDYTPEVFFVDKTAPTLEIAGVADKSANNGKVAPVISYSDTNFNRDDVSITLTGIKNGQVDYKASYEEIANGQIYTYANFVKSQKVDDIYTLTVKLTDMAGNETQKTITFSVNRFGSIYDLTKIKDIISNYLQSEEDIIFTETNVDSLERKGVKLKLIKNGTPIDLVEGTDYTIEVSGGNGKWSVYKYIIKKALFADDGRYSLSVYSKDAAGNVNENIDETKKAEISFGIDKTSPVIVPIDFESGVQYAVDMKTVSVEIKDNLVLEDVKIFLNGEKIDYKVNGETYTFNVPQSNSKQDVKIVAVDAAGNEQPLEINGFLVNTNIFVRWYNNTPLFIGSIIAVAALAIGITLFITLSKKKKKEKED